MGSLNEKAANLMYGLHTRSMRLDGDCTQLGGGASNGRMRIKGGCQAYNMVVANFEKSSLKSWPATAFLKRLIHVGYARTCGRR